MSAPAITQARLAVGQIGEHAAAFQPAHRDGNPTPVTTVVTLTVPMSHEDVEAVLWRLLRDECVTFADLDDDAAARWLLLDAILGAGVAAIESYRLDLADMTSRCPDYPDVLRLRARVEALIGAHPRRRRPRSIAPTAVRTPRVLTGAGAPR